ncbi:MAG: hypothetical protein KAQ87_00925 [Candidatus Pacebacteria bacterium]|nr:hypothetical protein [Candidatus Paceibacterota bacterium]
MKIGEQPEKLNNVEEQQERENMITGKELEGRNMVQIGKDDLTIYEDYLKKNDIVYEIYNYKKSPDRSLLVLYTQGIKTKQIFDEIVKDNKEIVGGFWPTREIDEEVEIELASDKVENIKEEFAKGDSVELTDEKMEELGEKLAGFAHGRGEISTVSGDMASVDFEGSVRLVSLKGLKKM